MLFPLNGVLPPSFNLSFVLLLVCSCYKAVSKSESMGLVPTSIQKMSLVILLLSSLSNFCYFLPDLRWDNGSERIYFFNWCRPRASDHWPRIIPIYSNLFIYQNESTEWLLMTTQIFRIIPSIKTESLTFPRFVTGFVVADRYRLQKINFINKGRV